MYLSAKTVPIRAIRVPLFAPERVVHRPDCAEGPVTAIIRAMEHDAKQRDRNLLFAIFAVQLLHVPPVRIMEVAAAWATGPDRDLADRMVDAHLLTPEDRAFLWGLVDRSVEAHVGDVVAALETLGGEEQLHQTFGGGVRLTPDGVEFIPPPGGTRRVQLGDLPGVPETPGRYSHISEFARGGMGRVYLVHDIHLGRDIALKELLPPRPGLDSAPPLTPVGHVVQITARFLQEARITGQLEHPSIVPVYELGHRADGSLYYTMKLVRGRTLSKVIAEAGDLAARLQVLPHLINLCQAIAYAHSKGVLHRDLKPSNVMIGEFGETVVIDWGLAKAKDQPDIHATPLASLLRLGLTQRDAELEQTEYGQVLGTPHYMPPEQAKGDIDALDERCDVYALGAILYQLLTGRTPFQGSTTFEVLNRVLKESPAPISSHEPEAPPELVAICERAMCKNPAERYQTARELAQDIQRFMSGALVQAYRYRFSEHLKRFARQHRAVLSAAAVSLAALFALGVYYNVHLYRAREGERRQRIAAEAANRKLEWEYYSSALTEARSNIESDNPWKAVEILQRLPEQHREWEWGRLLRESSPAVYSVTDDPRRGMIGMPMRAIFSQDGRYVLQMHDFGGVKTIFDIKQGKTIYVSEPDRFLGRSWCSGFTKDSRAITVAEDQRNVILFDYARNKTLARYSIASGWLCALVLSPDEKLAVGCRIAEDKHAREVLVWDAHSGKELARYPLDRAKGVPYDLDFWGSAHEMPYANVLGFLNDGRRVVCSDNNVVVLDIQTGEKQTVARSIAGEAALAPAKQLVATYVPNESIEVWRVSPPELVIHLDTQLHGLRNVAITPDGKYVATVLGRSWKLWSVETGQLLRSHVTDRTGLESISFSPNGACAVTYGSEMTLRFWDLRHDRLRESIPFTGITGIPGESRIHRGSWPNMPNVFNATCSLLAHGYDDGTISIWKVPSFELVHRWQAHDRVVTNLAWSPDSETLYSTCNDGLAKAWNLRDYSTRWTISAKDLEPAFAVACSPNGTRVAVGFGVDTSVGLGVNHSRVVDAETGRTLFELQDPPQKTSLLAFSPDNRYLITGSWGRPGTDERSVLFYDASDGTRLPYAIKAIGWPYQALGVPGSSCMLFLGLSREPVLYDLQAHREVYRVQRYDVSRVAVHPDGHRFVGISGNRALVFALSDGRHLLTLDDCEIPLTFTADGRSLVTRTPHDTMQVIQTEDWTLTDESKRQADGLKSLQTLLDLN